MSISGITCPEDLRPIHRLHVPDAYDTGLEAAPRRRRAQCSAGDLLEHQSAEELYDLESDPDEVVNLAQSGAHREILERLRARQREFALDIRDVGFLPEGEIHGRSRGSSPFETGHDEAKHPLKRIIDTAEQASSLKDDALPALEEALRDQDSAVRYWAAQGILMRGRNGIDRARGALAGALADGSPYVRVVAAQALAQYGTRQDRDAALPVLLNLAAGERNGVFVALVALNALDEVGDRSARVAEAVRLLGSWDAPASSRMSGYVRGL